MTKEEIQIAQAAYCVGKMWDEYEGTEDFDCMVGKRVQHLIELVRKSQPSLPSDLNEAAEEFTRSEYSSPCAFGGENIEEWVSRIFKSGAEWMAGQGFPNWRDINKTKPKQGEPCACVTVAYNGRIKYNNFENGPWYWSDEADFLSEEGAFVGTNDWGDKETHSCSYWMPWDELFAVLEKQFKEKQ